MITHSKKLLALFSHQAIHFVGTFDTLFQRKWVKPPLNEGRSLSGFSSNSNKPRIGSGIWILLIPTKGFCLFVSLFFWRELFYISMKMCKAFTQWRSVAIWFFKQRQQTKDWISYLNSSCIHWFGIQLCFFSYVCLFVFAGRCLRRVNESIPVGVMLGNE